MTTAVKLLRTWKASLGLMLLIAVAATGCESSEVEDDEAKPTTSITTGVVDSAKDAAKEAKSPTAETLWSGDIAVTIDWADPRAAGQELNYATGDVVENSMALKGVCDGSEPCTLVSAGNVVILPGASNSLTPTGSGYTLSWENGNCRGGGTVQSSLTIAIQGEDVSGTYNDPENDCLTGTKATFTGRLERVSG